MTFFIPGKPVGKQSVRTSHGHAYIPSKSRSYMALVTTCANLTHKPPIEGAVDLTITEYRQRPKYHFDKNNHVKQQYQFVNCMTKPDISNVLKAIEDGMNKVAFVDDRFVVSVRHTKRYANEGERVGVFVTVEPASVSKHPALPPEHRNNPQD